MFGIGKSLRNVVYVHKNYEFVLPSSVKDAKLLLPKDFEYTIIKHNKKEGSFSFIESPEFDSVPEPAITKSCKISAGKSVKCIEYNKNPPIYHGKYRFVGKGYEGFDIEESKKREDMWKRLPKIDYNRIGRRDYWNRKILPLLEQADKHQI